MKLLRMQLENFKGIRSLEIEPDGEPLNVFGDNATGKTTLADAFSWLVSDKDSTGRKDFDIKTLDAETGDALHNLEHAVEAALDVSPTDSARVVVTLRKVYREVYTRKRGSATDEFTGHTTDYFVDGVPVPLKDYKEKVAEICGDEETFRLLTNPDAFNALPWQKRRSILVEISGDVSDEDVIATDPKRLGRLPEILGSRTLDDHRKVMAERRKKINEELKAIPVRISEVERGLGEKPTTTIAAVEKGLGSVEKKLAAKREEKSQTTASGAAAALAKRKTEIETAILTIDNEAQRKRQIADADVSAERTKRRTAVSTAKDNAASLRSDLARLRREIGEKTDAIATKNGERERLRAEWRTIDERVFEKPVLDGTCSACGQALPEEKLEETAANLEAEFNRKKAEDLERVNASGRRLKGEVEGLEAEVERLREKETSLDADVEAADRHVAECEAEAEAEIPTAEIPEDPERAKLVAEKAEVEAQLAAGGDDATPQVEKIRAEIEKLEGQKSDLEDAKRAIEAYAKGKARIDELAQQEKDLAKEYEQLESDLFLAEEFIRAKVSLLEERINARFLLARFRLFEQQINGGLAECCETIVGGVPYGSGLNNGARIAAGLDIISTLSKHYGVTAPIFLDNAEAITVVPPVESQLIALYVKKGQETLDIGRR